MHKYVTWALSGAFALAGAAAMAAEHEVLLVEGGFFPEITYLSVGDTVVFANVTGTPENVVAADATWQTLEIPANGSYSMVVAAGMTLAFVYDEGSEAPKTGALSFDPAPLTAAAPTE